MSVIIYTLPNCVQCDQTKRNFRRAGVDFAEYDISTSSDLERQVRDMGFMAAPVVVVGDVSWSGFRPDLIKNAIDKIYSNNLRGK